MTIQTEAQVESVRFLDLDRQHAEIRPELDEVWSRSVAQSAFVGGEQVSAFEDAWAAFCGTTHAIGVANGTDALRLIIAGLGIGPGDEVIVPANTFIATAEAVTATGATPVFADVDPATLLVTEDTVRPWITPRTAALIAVSLFGQVADMDSLAALAAQHGIALIEDAAQSHAATWRGQRSGSFGVAAGFSFYPGKNLGAFGDGGAITTNDEALAARIRSIANHGRSPSHPFVHDFDGCNSRLDALQAGVLTVKLGHLERWTEHRRGAHLLYQRLIEGLGDPTIQTTALHSEALSSHHLEVIRAPDRDALREDLSRLGIATGVHYGIACHLQEPFRIFARGPLPIAEQAASSVVSLPMHPLLTDREVSCVVERLHEVLSAREQPGNHG